MKNNIENSEDESEEILPEVKAELSGVEAGSKQAFIILLLLAAIIGGVLAYFYINNDTSSVKQKIELPTNISQPAHQVNEVPIIPQLPDPPKLIKPPVVEAPPLPKPLPKPIELPAPVSVAESLPAAPLLPKPPISEDSLSAKLIASEEEEKRKMAKWKSNIILIAGVQPAKTPQEIQQEADFVCRGDLEYILPKGKIIDAVVESAINSDFGGEVKAIVSRDVYAENGRTILIRKGSKVFGEYATGIEGAYGRVSIQWNRIDLAGSCYTVNIPTSPTIDNLGRKGVQGRMDNKYKEKLTNAVLSSAFNIALANSLDRIVRPVTSSTIATTNQATASQLNNIALGIFKDTAQPTAAKIPQICAQVQAAITDKTSPAYTTFITTCSSTMLNTTGTDDDRLNTIMSAVNAASSNLLSQTDKQITPSQGQEASKQAFRDISSTVKDMMLQENFAPTISIDQGTLVKIYVNRDYTFPKKAFNKNVRIQ